MHNACTINRLIIVIDDFTIYIVNTGKTNSYKIAVRHFATCGQIRELDYVSLRSNPTFEQVFPSDCSFRLCLWRCDTLLISLERPEILTCTDIYNTPIPAR